MPTVSFQQGGAYTGALETTVYETQPDTTARAFPTPYAYSGTGAHEQTLLEFSNLFGDGPGQIPVGAHITSAVLEVNVTDGSSNGGGIYRMTSAWDQNSTWNSLGNGVQPGVETASTADLTFGAISTGLHDFDVTSSLQAWLSGTTTADQANAANQGWLFNSSSTDAWLFTSSEGASAPTLVVTYEIPPPSQLALEGPVSLNEGTSDSPTSFTFTVDRTGDTSEAATVDYAVTGSGTNPADASDFASGVFPSGTATFAPGETSHTIVVNVGADSTVESDESFTLSLSNATNGATITAGTTTGTIVNDDVPPPPPSQLALEGPVSLNEGTSDSPTAFTFTVDRTGDTSQAATVDYAVTGSGTNPADATDFASGVFPSGTVTFAPGETSHTIVVNVSADSTVESDESFTLSLSNATNGATITAGTTTGTIVNDDVPPPPPSQLALEGPVSLNEGTSDSPTAFTFTVDRTGDTSGAATVDYSVTGSGINPALFSDFTNGLLPHGTVNFAAGETSETITINVVGDTSVEPNKDFTVALSNPTSGTTIGTATATGTIVNDDASDGLVLGVREIDGSTYGNGNPSSVDHYGSTDPTDIVYNPADGTFFIVDSEIDEKPFYATVNMWHLDSKGQLIAPVSLESFTHEPTGAAIWVTSTGAQHLFISDDNAQKIYEVDLANPSKVLHSFLTTSFGCVDPEDICINQNNGDLFVMSENNHTVYEITQSGTLVNQTVLPDTFVPHPDPNMRDGGAEAIAYDPVKDVFWISGGFNEDIFEVSRTGQILNVIKTLEQYPNPSLTAINAPQTVYPKGLELAPSSDGSGHLSLWVTDYGRDQYPDGRVFEIMLNEMAPGATKSSSGSATISAAAPSPEHAATQSFTDGNDSYTVRTAGDYDLNLLGGNDTLTVSGGTNISARMGDGDDLVRMLAGAGTYTVYGEAGNDRLELYKGGTADGGTGDNIFNIRAGNGFNITSDSGNDRLTFFADTSGVNANLGDGNNIVNGYSHAISGDVRTGSGNDVFVDLGGATLHGGAGNDVYRINNSATTIVENAGEGTDSVQLSAGISYTLADNVENLTAASWSGSTTGFATLGGNALDNTITGWNNNERINGYAGDDHLYGRGGDDQLNGGAGNDLLDGGSGNDRLQGQGGNDTLNGRSGDDVMIGAAGNDTYYVDSLGDTVTENVNEGTDTVYVSVSGYTLTDNVENGHILGSGGLTLTGNAGDNMLYGAGGDDTLSGGGGNDTINGGAGNDTIWAQGSGTNVLYGSTGNDMIHGADGNDQLLGGAGDDTLWGGAGADILTGGDGSDHFIFTSTSDSAVGAADYIADWNPNHLGTGDVIDVSGIDANTALTGDQAFTWNDFDNPGANAMWYEFATNTDGSYQLQLYGDVNGDGVADFQIDTHLSAGGFVPGVDLVL